MWLNPTSNVAWWYRPVPKVRTSTANCDHHGGTPSSRQASSPKTATPTSASAPSTWHAQCSAAEYGGPFREGSANHAITGRRTSATPGGYLQVKRRTAG